ncbi:hypothetical protein [Nonomuraea sp. NPDC003214]
MTSAPELSAEQLVLYRSARSADAAFDRLRADLKRCPGGGKPRFVAQRVRIGDEAVLVTRESGLAWLAGRRGRALFVYAHALPKKHVTAPARKMAKKVCRISGVCR